MTFCSAHIAPHYSSQELKIKDLNSTVTHRSIGLSLVSYKEINGWILRACTIFLNLYFYLNSFICFSSLMENLPMAGSLNIRDLVICCIGNPWFQMECQEPWRITLRFSLASRIQCQKDPYLYLKLSLYLHSIRCSFLHGLTYAVSGLGNSWNITLNVPCAAAQTQSTIFPMLAAGHF